MHAPPHHTHKNARRKRTQIRTNERTSEEEKEERERNRFLDVWRLFSSIRKRTRCVCICRFLLFAANIECSVTDFCRQQQTSTHTHIVKRRRWRRRRRRTEQEEEERRRRRKSSQREKNDDYCSKFSWHLSTLIFVVYRH